MFAKLYETEKHGQILVMLDSNEDSGRPQIKVYFEPEGAGVCSVGLNFKTDISESDQWVAADKSLANFTEEFAAGLVEKAKLTMATLAIDD